MIVDKFSFYISIRKFSTTYLCVSLEPIRCLISLHAFICITLHDLVHRYLFKICYSEKFYFF